MNSSLIPRVIAAVASASTTVVVLLSVVSLADRPELPRQMTQATASVVL